MSLTEIMFVRHASVDYTRDPDKDLMISLSDIGRAQADRLRNNLLKEAGIKVAAIYSSDLPRAIETISPYAEKVGLPIKKDSRLREHNYRGDPKIFHEAIKLNPVFRHPGGEALHESGRRFLTAVDEIISNHAGQSIMISTHGTVFTEFMKARFDKSDDFYFQLSSPDIYIVSFRDREAVSYERLQCLLD